MILIGLQHIMLYLQQIQFFEHHKYKHQHLSVKEINNIPLAKLFCTERFYLQMIVYDFLSLGHK